MKRVYFVVGGLLVAGNVVGAVHWVRSSFAHRQGREGEATREVPELAASNQEASSGTSEEVQQLRADLQRKEAMIRTLTALPKAAEDTPTQLPAAPPPPPALDPPARTAELLDERMFTVPEDRGKAAEMEWALRDIVTPSDLDQVRLEMLHCGATLCKVSVSADSDAATNRSMVAMTSHLPKPFGASVVLQLGKGESAMYLAKSSQDLEVGSESAGMP